MAHIIDGPNQEFASRLISLRREMGITQHDLAQAIDVDKRSISMYENGRTFPREETLRRLAKVFDVEPYWLTTGSTQETKLFIEKEFKKSASTNLIKRTELLYIENWDAPENKKYYAEKPTAPYQSADISKFVPVVKNALQSYQAITYSGFATISQEYKEGTIIIIDNNPSLDAIPTGSDVIFRMQGQENKPGLRRLHIEPGMEPVLVAIDSAYNTPPIVINEINVELMAVVIGKIQQH